MLQVTSAGFGNLLNQLESLGLFQYVLPFLLIFAVVFAILREVHVFKNNTGAAVIVAFAIGLLSLQFDFVPAFFQNIFPKFGIGLSILLIALILTGAFLPLGKNQEQYKWIFFGLGALIFLIIIITAFSDWQFMGSYWWNEYGAMIIVAIVVIAAIVAVIVASKRDSAAPQGHG